jgi:hypothetical protein
VHGAAVHTQVLGHHLDATQPARQQQHDQLPHPVRQASAARQRRRQQPLAVARHHRVGTGVGRVQVVGIADDAVELVAELHRRAEHPMVHCPAGRRRVAEAHQPRPPARAHEHLQHAAGNAHHQFGGLAQRSGPLGQQFGADRHQAAVLVHLHRHGLVVHMDVAHQGLQRAAQRRLVAHQQGQRSEVGQPPRFGQPQPEGRLASLCGGGLQQAAHALGRHLQVGVAQAARGQAGARNQRARVHAAGLRQFGEMRQRSAADEGDHRISSMSRSVKSMSRIVKC